MSKFSSERQFIPREGDPTPTNAERTQFDDLSKRLKLILERLVLTAGVTVGGVMAMEKPAQAQDARGIISEVSRTADDWRRTTNERKRVENEGTRDYYEAKLREMQMQTEIIIRQMEMTRDALEIQSMENVQIKQEELRFLIELVQLLKDKNVPEQAAVALSKVIETRMAALDNKTPSNLPKVDKMTMPASTGIEKPKDVKGTTPHKPFRQEKLRQ